MGKEAEKVFCEYIQDGVTWYWRTRPSRKDPTREDKECVISCSGNDECARKQKPNWPGKSIEGAKPKNHCPICKEELSCEPLCF